MFRRALRLCNSFGIACRAPPHHTPRAVAKARKSLPAQRPNRKPAKPGRPAAKTARRANPAGAEWLRYAALAVISICIWCTVYDRWNGEAWSVPIEYGLQADRADVKSDLAGFKAAQDGYYFPGAFHNPPQLGAPYGGNWNDYPVTEDFLVWGTGILARVIGLFPAANFLILTLQTLAVLAFYYAARRLKCEWKWSCAGALLFGLAPYGFAHSLHHFVITAYWHMALALLVCYWLANGRGLQFKTRDYWIAIGVAVATGWQNVYYTNIFIQMVGICLIIQWLRHGWRAALPALSIGCAAFAAFMSMNLHTIGYGLIHGHNPSAAVRIYAHMEYYGLKLVDCFIPFPTHKIAALAAIGRHFYQVTILQAEIPPACYFGVVGIAAFLWMAVVTVRNAIARDRKRISLEAVLTLWIFMYATVGGVNAMLGVVGFEMFRSTTRYCIVILCISLMFAVRRLSLISRHWPSPWPLAAPLAIGLFGLWEFLPPFAGEDIRQTASAVNSDRTFAQQMEATLPKGGMVFQLPVMDFPESPAPGISAYEHFRPYFYTHDLRYSFGSDKGRVRDAWQRVVAGMQPAEQIATLERYGFSGIYIDSQGFEDGGDSLLAQYKAAGRTNVLVSPLRDLYCVVLNPSPNPELPPAGPLFADGWYTEQDSPNGQRQNLASGNASVLLTNPMDAPIEKYANFYIASPSPRTVNIEGDGAYQSWRVSQKQPANVVNLHLTLPPGQSRLVFTTDSPPTPAQMGPITFYLVNFSLSDSPRPEQ
jgi:phosphoglycerol transferase